MTNLSVLKFKNYIKTDIIDTMLEDAIISLANGNVDSLDIIYKETNRLVFSIAYSITHSKEDSEDIMMDTFLSIRKYANSYKINTNPLAWISTIAKNASKTYIKNKKKEVSVDNIYDSAVYKNSIDRNERDKINIALETAKLVLKENELKIVLLHLIDYLTFKEIGEIIHKNENTVRWAYNNAINKVRKKLNKEG